VKNGDSEAQEPVIHLNVCCDVTGMHPIVGNRYKKFGADYDLCQEAFDMLSEEEKSAFRLIATPEDAAHVHEEEELADLTASCMADIEETFKQLSEKEHQEAEAEAARLIAQAEAKAAEEAAAAKAAEEHTTVPLEWQGVVTALVNMGFSSSVAEEVTMSAQGNFDQALESALSYVPPPPPVAALIKPKPLPASPLPEPEPELVAQDDAWKDEWDCLVDELVEMGFEDVATNKNKVAEYKGDLKSTVTALISEERAKRSPQV